MAYTDIDKPSDYFNTVLYTGNDSTLAVTGIGFQPDWTWLKCRSNGGSASFEHIITDAVRGVNKTISSDSDAAETVNNATGYLSVFGSDGFTVTGGDASNGVGRTYASWNWKAGTSFTNDASSTGIGSIDSSGSFNNDAGFSIVSYTGNSPNATTIKHGLNSVPQMIIFKRRVGVGNFTVYHQSLGNTKGMFLTTTAAVDTSAGYFNNTTPTSSVFSLANSGDTNSNGNAMIAYCFAEKQGYSKFGSYVGNGNADGAFVWTGQKSAFIMIKATSGSENWRMYDNRRNGFNVDNEQLFPNTTAAESSDADLDILSSGFKCRRNSGGFNNSGTTYIFMAFAEQPFVTSTGIPTTAR